MDLPHQLLTLYVLPTWTWSLSPKPHALPTQTPSLSPEPHRAPRTDLVPQP